jgi:chromosome segregation ATPase
MATKDLTPRQQEIKALTEKGKKAPAIAKKLGITENAVYQHLRAIRGGAKKSSGSTTRSRSRGKAASTGRQSSRNRRPAAAAPAPAPVAATAEELLRQEIDGAQAGVSDLKGQIKGHQDEITKAEKEIEALTAEIERKGDVLAVLTGKKVARDKPKPSSAKKKAGGQSAASTGSKAASGSQASSQAPSNGGAAATPTPGSQAEREATADHDGPGDAPAPDPAPDAAAATA